MNKSKSERARRQAYQHERCVVPMQTVRTPECQPSPLCSCWLDVKQGCRKDTLHEGKQHGEDGSTDGLRLPREAIELALEGTAQGVDVRRRPGGQIGEGPRADLVTVTEGFT